MTTEELLAKLGRVASVRRRRDEGEGRAADHDPGARLSWEALAEEVHADLSGIVKAALDAGILSVAVVGEGGRYGSADATLMDAGRPHLFLVCTPTDEEVAP